MLVVYAVPLAYISGIHAVPLHDLWCWHPCCPTGGGVHGVPLYLMLVVYAVQLVYISLIHAVPLTYCGGDNASCATSSCWCGPTCTTDIFLGSELSHYFILVGSIFSNWLMIVGPMLSHWLVLVDSMQAVPLARGCGVQAFPLAYIAWALAVPLASVDGVHAVSLAYIGGIHAVPLSTTLYWILSQSLGLLGLWVHTVPLAHCWVQAVPLVLGSTVYNVLSPV